MPAMSASIKVRGRKRVWILGGPMPSLLICFVRLKGDAFYYESHQCGHDLDEVIDGLGAPPEDFRLDGRQLSHKRSTLMYKIL